MLYDANINLHNKILVCGEMVEWLKDSSLTKHKTFKICRHEQNSSYYDYQRKVLVLRNSPAHRTFVRFFLTTRISWMIFT